MPTCHGASNGTIEPIFTGGMAPYIYFWHGLGATSRIVTGLQAGTYSVTVTDINVCKATFVFTLNENLAPGPTAPDVTVCKGGSATLTASGAPTGGSYKWYTSATSSTPIADETSATFVTPKIKATTTWYVSSVTSTGCEGQRTAVTARMINPLYSLVDLDRP